MIWTCFCLTRASWHTNQRPLRIISPPQNNSAESLPLILHQLHHQSGANLDAFQISLALISGTKAEHNIHVLICFLLCIDQGSQLLLQRTRLLLKLRCFHRIVLSECEIKEFKYAVCLALIIGRIVLQIGHDVLYNGRCIKFSCPNVCFSCSFCTRFSLHFMLSLWSVCAIIATILPIVYGDITSRFRT